MKWFGRSQDASSAASSNTGIGRSNVPEETWRAEAEKHGADPSRAVVWAAFSGVPLGGEEAQLQRLADIIAASPFSLEELAHILFCEVEPVSNSTVFVPDDRPGKARPAWLIQQCLERQKRNPFNSKGAPNTLPWYVHSLALSPLQEAYYLLQRVKRVREAAAPKPPTEAS